MQLAAGAARKTKDKRRPGQLFTSLSIIFTFILSHHHQETRGTEPFHFTDEKTEIQRHHTAKVIRALH